MCPTPKMITFPVNKFGILCHTLCICVLWIRKLVIMKYNINSFYKHISTRHFLILQPSTNQNITYKPPILSLYFQILWNDDLKNCLLITQNCLHWLFVTLYFFVDFSEFKIWQRDIRWNVILLSLTEISIFVG